MRQQEVFNVFLNSGLHGGKWPSVVYCFTFCCLDDENMSVYVSSTPGGPHAEEHLMNLLRKEIQNKSLTMSQKLTLYVNYSPCDNCSDLISRFINEVKVLHNIDLIFDIAFPAFYMMRRPSCENAGCGVAHKLPANNVHDCNLEGLKKLQDHGVTLRPMVREDWEVLAAQLKVQNFVYPGSDREREDKAFKEDFDKVMNEPEATDGILLRGNYAVGDSDALLHQNWQWL